MRYAALVALLLLVACSSGRVDDVDSFVDRDVAAFAAPGQDAGPRAADVPGWSPVLTGELEGANASGIAAVYAKDGRRELVLDRFSGRGTVYLTRDGTLENAIALGQAGQPSYPVPGFAGEEYGIVLVIAPDGSVARASLR